MRRRIINNDMKDKILKVTLEIIDEKDGVENLRLRDITRRAGCSAPNIYNYFEDMEDLLNHARAIAAKYFLKPLEGDLAKNPEERFIKITERMIQAVLRKPAWYRFVYFRRQSITKERLDRNVAGTLGFDLTQLMIEISGNTLNREEALEVRRVLHSYLHGEMCKLASNMFPHDESMKYQKGIITHLQILFDRVVKFRLKK